METYLEMKHGFTKYDTERINWQGIEGTITKSSINKRTTFVKYIHNWLLSQMLLCKQKRDRIQHMSSLWERWTKWIIHTCIIMHTWTISEQLTATMETKHQNTQRQGPHLATDHQMLGSWSTKTTGPTTTKLTPHNINNPKNTRCSWMHHQSSTGPWMR